MHLEAVLHPAVYQARPDVGAVVHGHPPFATALGATDATLELLTHDAVLFADGVPVFEEPPELITDGDQGRAVAAALGAAPGRAAAQPRRARRRQGRPLGRAHARSPSSAPCGCSRIASHARHAAPDPARGRARACIADKYQDAFVDEYWDAWLRKLERLGADARMQA